MIQDIEPQKIDIAYKNKQSAKDAQIFLFCGDSLCCMEKDDQMVLPTHEMIGGEAQYLFCIDESDYFISFADFDGQKDGFSFVPLSQLRANRKVDKAQLFATFTAYHLYDWYESNRYCGRCANKTEYDATERAMYCPSCQRKIYPRINPAVIVAITKGDEIVVTRYRTGYAHNALVAGFAEIGETLEDTVRREVMEEVGLKVKNIRYYKSQPWGMATDLLVGFFCEVDGSGEIRMDESELGYAQWVKREELVLQPDDISLTNEMMKLFKSKKEA